MARHSVGNVQDSPSFLRAAHRPAWQYAPAPQLVFPAQDSPILGSGRSWHWPEMQCNPGPQAADDWHLPPTGENGRHCPLMQSPSQAR